MKWWNLVKKGKVRDIYESVDKEYIALVASDRVSAFDHILPVEVEGKGEILTKMSAFWFDKTKEIVPNAYIGTRKDGIYYDIADFIEASDGCSPLTDPSDEAGFDSRIIFMHRLTMLPIEAIVRGYITGSLWDAYKKGAREFCGLGLPDYLKNSSEINPPIFTPTTKAEDGEHDEPIRFDEMIGILSDNEFASPEALAERVRDHSLRLYNFAVTYALSKGIIIADTKFEFGVDNSGRLYVADELFTPDSSRFWLYNDYVVGREQKSMDKQIIRDYIASQDGAEITDIPFEVLAETKAQYERCLKMLTT